MVWIEPLSLMLHALKQAKENKHLRFTQTPQGDALTPTHPHAPLNGHQLPGFVALAHKHTSIRAVPQLPHGCVSVHLGKR